MERTAADLAAAIRAASDAGRWDVVVMLGRQLEALTLADAGNVRPLNVERWGR